MCSCDYPCECYTELRKWRAWIFVVVNVALCRALQKTLKELKDYQKKHDIYQTQNEKLATEQVLTEVKIAQRIAYEHSKMKDSSNEMGRYNRRLLDFKNTKKHISHAPLSLSQGIIFWFQTLEILPVHLLLLSLEEKSCHMPKLLQKKKNNKKVKQYVDCNMGV